MTWLQCHVDKLRQRYIRKTLGRTTSVRHPAISFRQGSKISEMLIQTTEIDRTGLATCEPLPTIARKASSIWEPPSDTFRGACGTHAQSLHSPLHQGSRREPYPPRHAHWSNRRSFAEI